MGSTAVIRTMPELARNAVLQAQQEESACDYRKGLKLLDAANWIVEETLGASQNQAIVQECLAFLVERTKKYAALEKAAVEVQHLHAHDEELAHLKRDIYARMSHGVSSQCHGSIPAAAPQGDAPRLRAENEQLRAQLTEQDWKCEGFASRAAESELQLCQTREELEQARELLEDGHAARQELANVKAACKLLARIVAAEGNSPTPRGGQKMVAGME